MKVQSRNKFLKDKQEAGEIAFKDKVCSSVEFTSCGVLCLA
jgi:hypothetical protein